MLGIYPCTIIKDRYQGAYSGGLWLAFNCDFEDIPEAVNSQDDNCRNFWIRFDKLGYFRLFQVNNDIDDEIFCGKGSTPDAALALLAKQLGKVK